MNAVGWLIAAVVVGQADLRAPDYPDHARLMIVRDGEGHERPVVDRNDWDVRRAHILAHFQEVA